MLSVQASARKVKDKDKGKDKVDLYSAIVMDMKPLMRSGMDHTVLPAITPMPAFTS